MNIPINNKGGLRETFLSDITLPLCNVFGRALDHTGVP